MAWNTPKANSMKGTFKDATSFNQPLAGGGGSGGDPIIEALSTLNIAGAGSVYTSDSSFSMADLKANGFSWMFYVDFDDPSKQVRLGSISGDSDATTASDFTILKLAGSNLLYVEAYNGSSYSQWTQSSTAVSGNGLTHVAISYTGTSGTDTLKLYIDGVEESSVGAPSWAVGEGGRISHGGADYGSGNFGESITGTLGTPFLFDRAITQAEILSISSGGTSLCYDEVDNTSGLKDAIIYAPTLGEYNGSSGQALVDPASGITTNESGTVTYDGTGISVDCGTTPVAPTTGLNTSSTRIMDNMLDGATSFDQDLAGFDVTSLTSAALMCNGIQLSTENYDSLLNGWSAQAVQSNVVFDGGLSTYSATGQVGRDDLTDNHLWVITDGGSGGGGTIYNVNSFSPSSSGQYVQNTSYSNTYMSGDWAWNTWVKLSDIGVPQSLLRVSGQEVLPTDVGLVYDWTSLGPASEGMLTLGVANQIAFETFEVDGSSLIDGNWHLVSVSVASSVVKIYIDTVEELSQSLANGVTTSNGIRFGTVHNSLTENLRSPFGFYSVAHQALDATDISNLYNDGTPTCLADVPTITKDKLSNWWDLGLYNGSNETQALADLIGSTDFINTGSIPFTDQGLTVECS